MADNFHVYCIDESCVIWTFQYKRDFRKYRLITLGEGKNTLVGEKGKSSFTPHSGHLKIFLYLVLFFLILNNCIESETVNLSVLSDSLQPLDL